MSSPGQRRLVVWGGLSFISGAALVGCGLGLATLPDLRGPSVPFTLAYFTLAALFYWIAVARLERDRPPLATLWIFAVLMRLPLLRHPPTLSDDVYRYIWDGHLLTRGISPYAQPANSALLDAYTNPLRGLVNHNWMASPYLPVAQLYSALIEWLAPLSPLAFQASALVFDLAVGWLVISLLRRAGLPARRVLVYLWNPLVAVESAHGAHVDYLMLFFMLLAFWVLEREDPTSADQGRSGFVNSGGRIQMPARQIASGLALGAAVLIKLAPVLIAPLLLRRWGWRGLAAFGALILGLCAVFAAGGGWGLSGPLAGRGLFGAIRIYLSSWNHNSSLYHLLEVWLTGYKTAGGVPPEPAYVSSIQLAKTVTTGLLGAAVLAGGALAWRLDSPERRRSNKSMRSLLRLAVLPLGAYLLLTTTVHPWYLVIVMPFLPFFWWAEGESWRPDLLTWPWLYLSCSVAFSYVTYMNPTDLHEQTWVRQIEYLPFYVLLAGAFIHLVVRLK
jgi:hypothetical protein